VSQHITHAKGGQRTQPRLPHRSRLGSHSRAARSLGTVCISYICIYVHIHIYVHIYTYVYMYVYMYTCTYMLIGICTDRTLCGVMHSPTLGCDRSDASNRPIRDARAMRKAGKRLSPDSRTAQGLDLNPEQQDLLARCVSLIYVYTYTYINMYIYIHMYTYMYTYIYIHIPIHTYTFAFMYTCLCIYMYTHTHTHIHIHICVRAHFLEAAAAACLRTYVYIFVYT